MLLNYRTALLSECLEHANTSKGPVGICLRQVSKVLYLSCSILSSNNQSLIFFQVIGNGVGFYQEFFNNLQEGLMKEHVQNSPSECSAVIAAFMECLRFCLLHDFADAPNITVQEYLIKDQVRSLYSYSCFLSFYKCVLQQEIFCIHVTASKFYSVLSVIDSLLLN